MMAKQYYLSEQDRTKLKRIVRSADTGGIQLNQSQGKYASPTPAVLTRWVAGQGTLWRWAPIQMYDVNGFICTGAPPSYNPVEDPTAVAIAPNLAVAAGSVGIGVIPGSVGFVHTFNQAESGSSATKLFVPMSSPIVTLQYDSPLSGGFGWQYKFQSNVWNGSAFVLHTFYAMNDAEYTGLILPGYTPGGWYLGGTPSSISTDAHGTNGGTTLLTLKPAVGQGHTLKAPVYYTASPGIEPGANPGGWYHFLMQNAVG